MSTQLTTFTGVKNDENTEDLSSLLNFTYMGIITFSPLLQKENVICYLLDILVNKKRLGYVMSYDDTAIVNTLRTEYEDKLKFINFSTYSDIESLYIVVNTVIIIDDINIFKLYLDTYFNNIDNYTTNDKLIDFYTTINNNNNYFLVISESNCSYATMASIIPTVDEDFQNRPIFFTMEGPTKIQTILPEFRYNPVTLTEEQKNIIRDRDPLALIMSKLEGDITAEQKDVLKFFNISYPNKINTLIKDSIDKDTKPINISNLIKIYGIDEILKNGPKFKNLYDNIVKHPNERHVIICSDDKFYGMDLLKEIFEVDEDDDNIKLSLNPLWLKQREQNGLNINTMKEFNTQNESNDYNHKVLITDMKLLGYYENENELKIITAKDVNYLHIIEPDFKLVTDTINSLYKFNNYSKNMNLTVHLYYTSSKISNLEQLLFEKFYKNIRENYIFYNERYIEGFKLTSTGEVDLEKYKIKTNNN
jgi:hypothetical protein